MHQLITLFLLLLASVSLQGTPSIDSLRTVATTTNNDSLKLDAWLALGDYYLYKQLDSANHYYFNALDLAKSSRHPAVDNYIPQINYYIGAAYIGWGYVNEGIEYAELAAQQYKDREMEEGVSDAYMMLGSLHSRNGDGQKGADLLHESISIKKRIQAYKKLGHAYMNLALVYRDLGQLTEAVEVIDSAIIRFKAQEFEMGVNRSYQIKGEILKFAGENEKALKVYQEALELYKHQKDRDLQGEIILINSIAGLYRMLGEGERALDYYKDALELLKEGDLKELSGLINHNIGGVYLDQLNHDSALVYLDKGLLFYEEIQHPTGLSRSYRSIGSIYKKQKNYDEAIAFYTKATAVLATKKNLDYGDICRQLAELYFSLYEDGNIQHVASKESHLEKAAYYVEESILCPSANLEASVVRYNIGKKVYEALNKPAKALEYANEIIVLSDSMFEQGKIDAVLELETKYQTEKKELEIENLNQEQALQLAENKRQKLMLYSVATVLSVVLLLLFLLYRSFVEKRATNKALAAKNRLISEQKDDLDTKNQEKELLLKEIHHRVKNNLQIISSLLDLQSSQIEDASALTAIEDGQSRVRSMALIHHKLYQNEDMAVVNFYDYVTQLLSQIMSTLLQNKPEIKILVPEDTSFDIDTAIPLGLILNELLTNACKYAFNETESPIMWIELTTLEKGHYQLAIRDNGPGMPAAFNIKKAKSLGLRLVRRLSKQLQGKASYENQEGACFLITFKDTTLRKTVA